MKLGVALLLASLAAACDEVDGAASEGVWDGGGGQTQFPCTVKKKVLRISQRIDFDVVGFSLNDSLPTTVGACTCDLPDDPYCYDDYEKCWKINDELYASDPDTYIAMVKTAEYDDDTNRPRYPGFRHLGNRPKVEQSDPEWEGQIIADACRKGDPPPGDGFAIIQFGEPDPYWQSAGWGVEEPLRDGCQFIDMSFKDGDHRRAHWLYPGQVEPNPEPDDLAGWLNDYPDGKGEQRWMDGHTTAIRVGLKWKELDDGTGIEKDYWLRQWHTEVGQGDRPRNEDVFWGHSGLVVYEAECPGAGNICWPELYVPNWDVNPPWGGLIKPKPDLDTFLTKVLPTPDGAGVELHLALLHRGSGDLEQVKETYDVVGSGFPAQRFSVLDLTMDNETAQRLFGMSMDGGGVFAAAAVIVEPVEPVEPRVRLVVGGATADGAPSSTSVWISRSWDARPTFRPLVSGLETGWVLDPNVVVDSIHERLLLVGGETADGPVDRMVWFDFETLGSGTWFAQGERKVQVPLPPDASAGRLASDTAGNRAFAVAGGRTGAAVFEFGWQSAVPWVRELTPATGPVPTPRKGAAVAWSSSRGSVLLYGGTTEVPDEGGVVERMNGELWSFDPRRRAWSPILDSGSALGRRDAMLSPGRTEVYLAGGCDASGGLPADSVLALRRTADGRGEARALAPSTLSVLQAGAAPHESVFRSAAPLAYSLRSNPGTERTSGSTVRVELDDPTGSLRLVALSPTGSGARGGETALSLSLHAGEEWTVRVVPQKGKEAQAEGAAFRVFAAPAEKGASLGSVSTTPLARFDAEGDILAVCRPNKLSLHRRQGDSLVAAGSVSLTVAADVDIQGHLAFVAEFPKGLKVVDISDPAAPVVVGSEWVLGFVDSVAVIGSRAYLGAGPFGVQVVDVSDPTDPRWVDTIDTGDVVVDVSATGGLLLVSKLISGEVEVHRVERGGTVSKIGEYQSRGWIDDAMVAGYTLYVRDKLGRLEVVDFRSPSAPRRLETLTGGGREEVSSRYGGRMVAEPGWPNKVRVYDVRAAVGE
jgi:hypothetical protein